MPNLAISVSQLESHLWEAANILRGPVDAADFKTYVFPLLSFKRISDVHDEEYQAALAEAGGDEEYARFPQNYCFQVPGNCHWRDVRAVTSNAGQALQKAMRGIEKANPESEHSALCGWPVRCGPRRKNSRPSRPCGCPWGLAGQLAEGSPHTRQFKNINIVC